MPEISIIIPVFNCEKTIRKTVESIVYGNFKNVEIILVDDCSVDNSWAVCQELKNNFSQIISIKNKQNQGVSFTRNRGIDIAKGKYILFVDSDDWVSKNYIYDLYTFVKKYSNSLIISGFHFTDYVNTIEKDYLYDVNQTESIIGCNELYKLLDKVLIQQLWNKIFKKDIIKDFNIYFDTNQSIGEDFEFVLDYINALNPKNVVIINKPLYYYTRINRFSLMNNFGFGQIESDLKRYQRLFHISGIENLTNNELYNRAVDEFKNNIVFHIVKKKMPKTKKLYYIKKIYDDEDANTYYRYQKKIIVKESILSIYTFFVSSKRKMNKRVLSLKNNILINFEKRKLKTKDFTIISQNCIGGVIYHDLGLKFNSPTINTYIKAPDFIKFISNLEYYLSLDLIVFWDEKYPIGRLDDIYIHFMHYNSCTEAIDSWNRRKQRVNLKKILVLCTDRDGFDDITYQKFIVTKYPKILFTCNKKYSENSIYYSKYKHNKNISDLIPKREFYKKNIVIKVINSLGKENLHEVN